VCSAIVAANVRRGVARDSAGGTKPWNAKAREGHSRRGYPLVSRPDSLLLDRPPACAGRLLGMVGRERRSGRYAASGVGRDEAPNQPAATTENPTTAWRTERARRARADSRLSGPYPRGRCGKRGYPASATASAPRAFIACYRVPPLDLKLTTRSEPLARLAYILDIPTQPRTKPVRNRRQLAIRFRRLLLFRYVTH